MATIAPIQYIEIVQEDGETIARIAGTRLTVGEIAHMHLYQDSPVDWIVENFDNLSHAQVYAALSHYFDHQAEIDAMVEAQRAYAESHADAMLADLIDKAKKR